MKIEKRIELGKAIQALVKSTGQSEGVNADGGYTVNRDILPDILSATFSEGSLYSRCKILNVTEGKNGMKIPVADEVTRTVSSIKGGFRAYRVKEGVAKTPSTGKFAQLDLKLNKEAVVIYATDELIQDSEAIASYLNNSAEEALMALADDSIVHGNSICNGIASELATGFVSVSDPITQPELRSFFDKYYGGKNGVWVMSKVRFNQIVDLYESAIAAGAGGSSIMLTCDAGVWYLYGYEIVISDTMIDNEMLLADFSQYVVIQKEMTKAVNNSLKWVEDESAFRFVLRLNGASMWVSPITLGDGSVVHPFVMTAGMEDSSSSDSSGSSQSNSSESSLIDSSSSSKSSLGNSESSSESSQSNSSVEYSSSSSKSSVEYSSSSSESSQSAIGG